MNARMIIRRGRTRWAYRLLRLSFWLIPPDAQRNWCTFVMRTAHARREADALAKRKAMEPEMWPDLAKGTLEKTA